MRHTEVVQGVEISAAASKAVRAGVRGVGLARRFRSGGGELVIFEDLSLEVRQGELVAIVGESGSGKSSLLHLLGGLDTPSAGTVYFDSDSGTTALSSLREDDLAHFRNREIGFVWQQHYLLPEFTAVENVMMPLLIAGDRQPRPRALDWLDRVGLAARSEHRAGELSGGEQQRVAMARALACGPRYLLADEPTGNLDERTGEAVFALLRQLHASAGLTSVVVTHNHRHAAGCDRILCLRQGKLEEIPAASLP